MVGGDPIDEEADEGDEDGENATSESTESSKGLSVIMPAHDEEAMLANSVATVVDWLDQRGLSFELLVVENGSRDSTLKVAHELSKRLRGVRVMSLPEPNYGKALREGLFHARYDTVVLFDVDCYDLNFLSQALEMVEDGDSSLAAIVVGSKRAPGASDLRPWHRRLLTRALNLLLKVGFGLEVSDTHGMKVLRRDRLEAVIDRCQLEELFDTELILRSQRAGLKTVEIPVTVAELRPPRTSVGARTMSNLIALARLKRLLRGSGK